MNGVFPFSIFIFNACNVKPAATVINKHAKNSEVVDVTSGLDALLSEM